MRNHRLLLAVTALSLVSLTASPIASFAREAQPGDDRGKPAMQRNDDRGVDPRPEVRHDRDNDAGDDRGVDAKPEARHGADNDAGDDRGVDPTPHA